MAKKLSGLGKFLVTTTAIIFFVAIIGGGLWTIIKNNWVNIAIGTGILLIIFSFTIEGFSWKRFLGGLKLR